MATYFTARKGFTKPKGSLQEIMDSCMSKDIIIVNQKTLDLPKTLELKGGVILQGDPEKPKPVINVKERQAGLFVGAAVRGEIVLKHLDIRLGDSSIGFKSNSNESNIVFEDVNFTHRKTVQSPYRSVIIDAKNSVRVTIKNSIIDSCIIYGNDVLIERSNIGDWFLDDSQIYSHTLSASNSALQNILISKATVTLSECLIGGNVRLSEVKGQGRKIQLTRLPVLNFRGSKAEIKEDATSLIISEKTQFSIEGLRQDDRLSNRIERSNETKNIVLPEWRAIGIIGGSLTVLDGILYNATLKNVARQGEILFENVQDDSSWEISNEMKLSNRNSKSSLFSAHLENASEFQSKHKTALDQLDELIGLDDIKERVRQMVSQAAMDAERKRRGVANSDLKRTLNIVFAGNPGTGKTVVARLVGQALYEAGVLRSTTFVEARQKDFVGEHVGETTQKTANLIAGALDGVLFIDEAYELAPPKGGGNTFNDEAVTELIANMENYGDRLVVLMAGYTKDMRRFFKDGNSGLASRMNNWIEFPDYSPKEMKQILRLQLKQSGARFKSKETIIALDDGLMTLNALAVQTNTSGNGRLVRNYIQKITEIRDARLSKQDISTLSNEQLLIIETEDIQAAVQTMRNQMETMR